MSRESSPGAGTDAQSLTHISVTNPDLLILGVTVSELSFTDGSAPAQDIVDKWLCLVNKVDIT